MFYETRVAACLHILRIARSRAFYINTWVYLYRIDRIKVEVSALPSSGPSGRVKRTTLVRLSPRPRAPVLQPINKRFARITSANGSRTRKQAWHLHRCATAIEEVPQETMCNSTDFPPKRKADGLVVHDPASASDPLGVCLRKKVFLF